MSDFRAALLALAFFVVTPATGAAQTCYQYPFDPGTITDPWGCAASCGRTSPHRGVDFGVGCGSAIPAVADGTVIANEHSGCLGWVIAIQHPDGVVSGYAHMPTQSPLPIGTVVARGQTIGTSGQNGTCAQGCHLHLTMGTSPDSWWTGTTFDPIGYISSHTACSCDRTDGHFTFSCDGANAGLTCVSVNEPADPDSWADNFLCTSADEGVVWSTSGPIATMTCTALSEAAETHAAAWADDNVCVPTDAPYELRWSSAGPVAGWSCVNWNEPADHDTWTDNYLCERAVGCFHAAGFTFCGNGAPAGEACVSVNEPSDPDTWSDNFFCASDAAGGASVGLRWSYGGPIAGMRCTNITEAADPQAAAWSDNYLCLPTDSEYELTWSSAGHAPGLACVRWYEAADLHGTWNDNYLCVRRNAPDAGAVLTDASSTPDAAVAIADAARAADASHGGPPLHAGCGCHAVDTRASGSWWLLALLGAFLARRRAR